MAVSTSARPGGADPVVGTDPLQMAGLVPLMERTAGDPAIAVAMIDGPVASHPDLEGAHLQQLAAAHPIACSSHRHAACVHGTFVAGMLGGRRDSGATAICPECTLLIRPIFSDRGELSRPVAVPAALSSALLDCISARARVINVSASVSGASVRDERQLQDALDLACARGVLVVAAAGNDGNVGSNALTRHPWVLSVVSHDRLGRPAWTSNQSRSTARNGVSAPGEDILGLDAAGGLLRMSGTSFAAPFVTGAVALLWSGRPAASPLEIRSAVLGRRGRPSLVPPRLDAWAAYLSLSSRY